MILLFLATSHSAFCIPITRAQQHFTNYPPEKFWLQFHAILFLLFSFRQSNYCQTDDGCSFLRFCFFPVRPPFCLPLIQNSQNVETLLPNLFPHTWPFVWHWRRQEKQNVARCVIVLYLISLNCSFPITDIFPCSIKLFSQKLLELVNIRYWRPQWYSLVCMGRHFAAFSFNTYKVG